MSRWTCDQVQDVLPEHVAGGLHDEAFALGVREHLAQCAECRAVCETVAAVAGLTRPATPLDLDDRVLQALSASRKAAPTGAAQPGAEHRAIVGSTWTGGVPARWLAIAAGLVLTLGTPLLMRQADSGASGADLVAGMSGDDLEQVAQLLPGDDERTSVAGALLLDQLTDEELLALLEDLER